MEKQHDESKLPKWVQQKIFNLELEIERLQGLKKAHYILTSGKEWSTLPLRGAFKNKDVRVIYLLNRDQPTALCDVGVDDIVLIGRNIKLLLPICECLFI